MRTALTTRYPTRISSTTYLKLARYRFGAQRALWENNANSRILGYRQSLSKIDKPFLTMLDKLCLHFFCSCLQFSVLTRFVCRICLHFGPVFGGFFADKVCLQDLSAFWPGFGGFSADKVCLQSLSVRTSCADKVCLQNRCRQSLSACPRVRLQHPPDDKLCLQ